MNYKSIPFMTTDKQVGIASEEKLPIGCIRISATEAVKFLNEGAKVYDND